MARDTVGRTFTVAAILCVTCSVLVSSAAVILRPQQEANRELDRRKNILLAAGLADEDSTPSEITEQFERVEVVLINLDTGEPADAAAAGIDPATYDPREAVRKPDLSEPVEPAGSFPGVARRERYSFIYLIRDQDQIEKVVLPIYGPGLWSTLYGFLALESDLNTISGITFYEHGETPGLGGEVDNPQWKAQWRGKLAYDEQGDVRVEVRKGQVDADSPAADYLVDGLSGATITTRGVSNLVRYWIGPDGFGPYLDHLREGE